MNGKFSDFSTVNTRFVIVAFPFPSMRDNIFASRFSDFANEIRILSFLSKQIPSLGHSRSTSTKSRQHFDSKIANVSPSESGIVSTFSAREREISLNIFRIRPASGRIYPLEISGKVHDENIATAFLVKFLLSILYQRSPVRSAENNTGRVATKRSKSVCGRER